jgi:hypothetical protein
MIKKKCSADSNVDSKLRKLYNGLTNTTKKMDKLSGKASANNWM